jgi:HNH endonuclease
VSHVTVNEIRELVSYDSETGEMRWRSRFLTGKATSWDTKYAGQPAGNKRKNGYTFVSIHKKRYPLHRLAWLYVHGIYPDELDHWNNDPTDNRLANLRLATRTEQLRNTLLRSDNTSGFKGVYAHKGRWRAKINVCGEQIHLGTFFDITQAHLAYAHAADKYFREFARVV